MTHHNPYRSPEDAARTAAAGTQFDADHPAFDEHDDGPHAVIVYVFAAMALGVCIGLALLIAGVL